MEAAKRFNFFLAKRGISQYYSPRMIFFQKHFAIQKFAITPLDPMFKLMTSQTQQTIYLLLAHLIASIYVVEIHIKEGMNFYTYPQTRL
jgi:hypothetical protein